MTDRERALECAQSILPAVEVLARWFHEAYEAAAPAHGYQTRKASSVPWEQVPEKNRNLMIATAAVILGKLDQRVADAILEGEAVGLGGASKWAFVESTQFLIEDPRRGAYEFAAAQFDLRAAELRAQKGAA